MLRSASGIEDLGSRWLKHLGGVLIVEAAKQIYAASPIKKIRSRATRMIPASSARLTNLINTKCLSKRYFSSKD